MHCYCLYQYIIGDDLVEGNCKWPGAGVHCKGQLHSDSALQSQIIPNQNQMAVQVEQCTCSYKFGKG